MVEDQATGQTDRVFGRAEEHVLQPALHAGGFEAEILGAGKKAVDDDAAGIEGHAIERGRAGQIGCKAVFVLGHDIVGGIVAGAFAVTLCDPEIGFLSVFRQRFGTGDITEQIFVGIHRTHGHGSHPLKNS